MTNHINQLFGKALGERTMRFELFTLSALMVVLLALAGCQAAEQLETIESTVEATLTEDPGPPATEEPPTPEPTPIPPTLEPTPEPVAAYEPVFEPADCWWSLPESQPVECGYLIVPENRGDPDSPNIRVATAILRHPGGNPEPDPIVYVHGGPGGGFMSVLDLDIGTVTGFFETNRDVIYFDQRGNGLSEPALDCPDFTTALADLFDYTLGGERLTNSEAQDHLLGLLVDCGEAWGERVDLSTYDSPNTAADINDLRIALGYDQINVYAESYGPRVAQSLMRDYPDTVRSAVLDAAMSTYSPIDRNPRHHGGMLSHLFELCAADEACNEAFPDLRNVWLETLDEVDQNPVSLKGSYPLSGEEFDFLVDDGMLATTLFFLSYGHSALPAIPACIYAVREGDYSCIEQGFGRVTIRTFKATWPDWINVTCRQRTPISRVEDFEAVLETYPEIKSFWEDNLFISKRLIFNESLCEAWGGGVVAESEHEPVVSSIPTLLVLGDTDPASFLEESMGIAEGLENHFGPYHYPFLSHVVFGSHACPTSMVNAFIADPETEPDASCIDDMAGADFAIPGEGGEIALEPFTSEEMGYSGVIPSGWNKLDAGVFARGNPTLDPTILAQLPSPNETADDFLGEILTNLGVAALPDTPVRVMDSDALSWSLYLVSGDPTTAVALAESETTTYMVALKAAADEFDALADELLVPAIMAFTPFIPAVEVLTPVGGADVGFAIDPQAPFEEQMQVILHQAVEMGTPGAAMYVETAGGQVWLGASGKAILETGVDLSASDKFWIYSASKTFVAAVVMQLVEEGVLALDDPISDWLEPSLFASIPNGEAITIRMLLNHTSGIYDYLETEEIRSDMLGNPGQVWEPHELVQYAITYGSPYAEPGGALSYYANTNYVLLGLIIEQATGSPLATEIRNRILTPLNLENTYAWEEGVPGGHVSGYTMLNGERVDVSDLGLSWDWAAGGLVSNVEDIATFSKALFSGELFQQPETLDEMLAFVERYNQPGGYGLGVVRADFLSPVSSVPMIIDGGAPGFVSVGAHWLSTGETAVVFLNTDDDDLKFAILLEAIQAAELGQ